MSTLIDTSVLPLPGNVVSQGFRAISTAQQNGNSPDRGAQATFAGVLKSTNVAQTDGKGADTVQDGTGQNALGPVLQNPNLLFLVNQSLTPQLGNSKQGLPAQAEDKKEQTATDLSDATGSLMAALLSIPLQQPQAIATTTVGGAAETIQTVTAGKETATLCTALTSPMLQAQAVAGFANTTATVASMSTAATSSFMTMSVPSISTAASSLSMPAVVTNPLLQGQPDGGNIQQKASQAVDVNVLGASVAAVNPRMQAAVPGEAALLQADSGNAQQPATVGDRTGAAANATQTAASLFGSAVAQELNVRQISVTGTAHRTTALKDNAVSPTAVANGKEDGIAVSGKAAIAGACGADTQVGLGLAAAFAEPPMQDKEKALSGKEQTTDSFAVVFGQQADNLSSAGMTGTTAAQRLPDPHNVLGQVLDQANSVKLPYDAGNTEMVIKLKPENLGELTLKVTVDNGVVSAGFHSDNPEVRGIIQSSLQQLRQELTDRGLHVDNVGVYAGLADFSSNGQQEAFRQQQQQQSVTPRTANTADDFTATAESIPVLKNTAVDDGVDYRI